MVLYFLVVVVGTIAAARLIMGELRKDRLRNVLIVPYQPTDSQSIEPIAEISKFQIPSEITAPIQRDHSPIRPSELNQWEKTLLEKNREIDHLKLDLQRQKIRFTEFEKIKTLLERQIFESRQLHLTTKRDLENLKAQFQKSNDEISRLKVELNYKVHLLNQSEMKVSELKNRITDTVDEVSPVNTQPAAPVQDARELADFSFDQLDWRNKLNG